MPSLESQNLSEFSLVQRPARHVHVCELVTEIPEN